MIVNYLRLARVLGLDRDVRPSKELEDSAGFLGINASEVIIKARLALVLVLFSLTVVLFLFMRTINAVFISLGISAGVYYYLTERPKIRARDERMRALSHTPEIMTVLGTSIELGRNLEDAVRLAADYCGGRISRDLANAYKLSLLAGKPLVKSFNSIIDEWGEFSEGFKRGARLLLSALRESNAGKTVELAISTFLKSLSSELKNYLASIKTHTLVLFSFGTIMPLILISMMPVLNLLNMSASPILVGSLLAVNLLLLLAYSKYILNKRPPSFSQLAINPGKKGLALAVLLFFAVSSVSLLHYVAPFFNAYFPLPAYYSSLPLIVSLPVSLSAYYYMNSHSLLKKRNKAIRAEKEILGITYSLGISLQEKRSFEDALNQEAKKEGVIPFHLRRALGAIKDLKISPEKAVMKELSFINSNRVKSVFGLVFQALRQGINKGAGGVLKIYEHFNMMMQSENDNKAALEQTLSMMKLTVVVFAPLISAFIVLMQQMINSSISSTAISFINLQGAMSIDIIEMLLGFYVTGLVIILTRYNVYLKSGSDKILLYSELFVNLLLSTCIYVGALLLAKTF